MQAVEWLRRCVSVRFVTLVLVLGLVAGACNRGGGPPGSVSVSGTLRSEGKPVTQGTVNFVAKEGAASGTAAVGPDGKFTVMLIPTAYRVAVIATEGVDTMDEKGTPIKAKSLVAAKYSSIETSGIEVNISSSNRTVDLDLKP